MRWFPFWLALLLGAPAAAQESAYETVVTATTPVHGSGLPREMVPANVQTATAADIAASRSLELTEFLDEGMGSVHLNQVLGNPLQADVQYRGFTASPVLGSPQGVAVFLDGVRLNEPFGDVVNWDFLPQGALRAVNLTAGSNPVFGLNTLGGALSLETRDGFSAPGAQAHLSGGSFARRAMSLELGAHDGHFAVFAAGDMLAEDGWREFSPSDAKRAFAVASFRDERTSVDFSLLGGDTQLDGNGATPVQLLAIDRRASFTHPDRTTDRLLMGTLRAEQRFSPDLRVDGVGYLRGSRVQTLNGDQAEEGAPTDAILYATDTRQRGYGFSLQLAWAAALRGHENHLFAGGGADVARARFGAQSTLAHLSSTREALSTDQVDPDSLVAVDTVARTWGVFATDTFSVRPDLFLTVAGRFNHERLTLDDRITDALDGRHRFSRFNPAVGLSYQPRPAIGLFAGYSESARAPTPLELSCASPEDPCLLPNSFVTDPPLKQVVARTLEGGVRGHAELARTSLSYDAALFRAATSDDILFVSAGSIVNQGYFSNVGRTRRQGLELGASGRRPIGSHGSALQASAHYTFLDATFRSPFVASSPNHPDAVDGAIPVPAGSRMPTVPRHLANASLTFVFRERLSLGGTVVVNGSQYVRGDEANRLPPIAGYAVVDLRASIQITPFLVVFARARNVFDARYSTYGVLGDARPVLGDAFDQPRFEGPGAPRGVWLGVDLRD